MQVGRCQTPPPSLGGEANLLSPRPPPSAIKGILPLDAVMAEIDHLPLLPVSLRVDSPRSIVEFADDAVHRDQSSSFRPIKIQCRRRPYQPTIWDSDRCALLPPPILRVSLPRYDASSSLTKPTPQR